MSKNTVLVINELKSKIVIGLFFALYALIGLLLDTIIYNMPSLSYGFYSLLTFRVFPMATTGMIIFGAVSMLITYTMYDKIMLYGHEYRQIDPSEAQGFEKRLYDMVYTLAKKDRKSVV